MARPRKNLPAYLFTATEVAVGAGISARAFGLLVERGLAPKLSAGAAGKAGARLYDEAALGRAAFIGAITFAGIEILPAARLGNALADELESNYGLLSANLEVWVSGELNPRPREMPWPDDLERTGPYPFSRDRQFWLHRLLRAAPNYLPETATGGDWLVEIADRTYVFMGADTDVLTVDPLSRKKTDLLPEFRLSGWERGADAVRVISMMEDLPPYPDWFSTPDGRAASADVSEEYQARRRNAVARVRVNLSLAVRNAFDRVHDHRTATCATLNWDPPPGYDND
jgi:hypothetical protein